MIGLGGFIGATARYSISILLINNNGFPFATFIANLIGCFLLGFLLNHQMIRQKMPRELFIAVTTGVIGSFTTFSTFTVETVTLWVNLPHIAIIYVFTSIGFGLLLCYVGYLLATRKQVDR